MICISFYVDLYHIYEPVMPKIVRAEAADFVRYPEGAEKEAFPHLMEAFNPEHITEFDDIQVCVRDVSPSHQS